MDWKSLITDLCASGMTQKQIADACNTGQSHISSLANGHRKEPGYTLGDRLKKLHDQRCKAGGVERRTGTEVMSGFMSVVKEAGRLDMQTAEALEDGKLSVIERQTIAASLDALISAAVEMRAMVRGA